MFSPVLWANVAAWLYFSASSRVHTSTGMRYGGSFRIAASQQVPYNCLSEGVNDMKGVKPASSVLGTASFMQLMRSCINDAYVQLIWWS